MNRIIFPLLLLTAACKTDDKGGSNGTPGDDSGTPSDDSGGGGVDDTGTPPPPCKTVATEIVPEEGETDWFYRDPLEVTFSDDAAEALIQLFDPDGAEVPTSISWGDGNFVATVSAVDGLRGSTTYTLHVEICEYSADVSFTTSVYGSPMEMEAAALVGLTYVYDLSQADITQPEGVGYLLAGYLTEPLLIGVDHADESAIGLVGAQGYLKNDGTYKQVGSDVWIFPDADFTGAPFFSALTDSITIDYYDISIPVEQFYLAGTFAPDGSAIGGSEVSGWVDTRNMGPLIKRDDDPNAICGFIESLEVGVSCSDCSDGEPYCLFLEAWLAEAPLAEGVTIDLTPDDTTD